MLNKIILLNSAKYQKAVITFDRNAIQICGGNNAGKTSLISVLNFLYLPSPKDWEFDKKPPETLKYYFEKLDKSYIIFEIFSGSYFCILIRRNENNKLIYSKIQSPYDEFQDSFFKQTDNGKALLDFESILSNMLDKIKKLTTQEFKDLLYGQSKRDKTVLWLEKDTTQKSFNDIYKYLLNTKLINNEVVKKSLLVADGKHNISREFTVKDHREIELVKQHQQNINTLEEIKSDFSRFKDIVDKYNAKKNELDIDYQSFYNLYNQEMQKNKNNLQVIEGEKEQLEEKTNNASSEKNKIATELGKLKERLENKTDDCNLKSQKIAEIEQHVESFLNAELEKLQEEDDRLKYALSQIKNENHTKDKIDGLISEQKTEIKKLEEDINNFDNLLIHHIAKNTETQETINSLLKGEVLKLDQSCIIQPIQNADNKIVDIFDGKINISSIKKEKFITINELRSQLDSCNEQLKKYQTIQGNISDKQGIKDRLKVLVEEIKDKNNKITDVENLPTLKKELKDLEGEKDELDNEIEKLRKSDEALNDKLKRIEKKEKEKDGEYKKYTDRKSDLEKYYYRFEDEIGYLQGKNNNECDLSIDKLVEKIKKAKTHINDIKDSRDKQFTDLKEKLKKEYADEVEFIQEIKGEIATIDAKKATVEELVKNITHDISDPTRKFLTSLEDFKGYITSLNTKFKKYRISNLSKIEINIQPNKDLEQDLGHIADIDVNSLFVEDNNKKIEILLKYIREGRAFELSDLFDFTFMINGTAANLGGQTESHGTDRVLKIILFILIMKALVIQDKNNKLIIYIDELGEVDSNISQLIEICKESNFVPIFASPDKKPHIDKYYDLLETSGNEKIVVDDNRAIYANKN